MRRNEIARSGPPPAMNTRRLYKVKAMKNITNFGMGVVLLLGLAVVASAQNQSQPAEPGSSGGTPLGDYARHVRKDSGATSKPKVFDNDNLPQKDNLSVVDKPANAENAAPDTKPEETAAAAESGESKAAAEAKAPANPGPVQGDEATRKEAIKQWSEKIDSQQ